MILEIVTDERELVSDLLGASEPEDGHEVRVGDARVVYRGTRVRRSVEWSALLEFSISYSSAVAASLLANWLWSRLSRRGVRSLAIDGVQVEIREDVIRHFLEERAADPGHETDATAG